MIRAPDVNDAIKTAFELFEMIGDIAGEIGVLTVLTLYDTVFFVAKGAGAKPLGAVLHIDVAALLHLLHGAVHLTGREQRTFRKPAIKSHTKFSQIVAAIVELSVQRLAVNTVVVRVQQLFRIGNQIIKMAFGIGSDISSPPLLVD